MADEKLSTMLAVRMSEKMRARLEEIAEREERTVSSIALRAIELGLQAIESQGFSCGDAKSRGDDFERAVVDILIARGLLAAAEAPQQMAMSSKRLGPHKKKINNRKAS
jgi:predicted DNA-binding protein